MQITQTRLNVALLAASLFLTVSTGSAGEDDWKASETAAAKATKVAHFAEAERFLSANVALSGNFAPKDPRRPRTLFDLAEVYRAEGKYSEAFPLYARALQIYAGIYGSDATEVADTLEGVAELYKNLNDYAHAESLLIQALDLRKKLLHAGDADIAQSENDLGEVYTATGAFDKAEPLLLTVLASRKEISGPDSAAVAQSLEA